MSYLVLARKYRPQTFEEMVGQGHITRTLQNAISSGRIAHAYLFSGTRGVGKTTAARILAKALNCIDGPTQHPCGKCPSCLAITSGTSIDVFEIDGASNTGVDDVRQLRENVKYAPSMGRYKVYIIDEVHMLSTNAFNALLKTLEEPPPHVAFIFATTDPHKIPDTILSRCQTYEFKLIPLPLLLSTLKEICGKEKIKMDEEMLMLVARKAEGSLRDGLSYLDQAIIFGADGIKREELIELLGVVDREFLLTLLQSILAGDVQAVLENFERTAEFRFEPRQFYQDLVELMRDLVVVKASSNPARLIVAPESEIKRLAEVAAGHSMDTLQRQFDLLVRAENEILRAGQPRLMLEMTLVKMAHARPVLPLDDLIDRLDRLIADVEGGPAPSERGHMQASRAKPTKSQEKDEGAEEQPAADDGSRASDEWRRLIVAAKAKKLGAGTLLSHGMPEVVGPELVRVKLQPAHLNLLGRAEDNEAVLDAVAEVFGPNARLELLPLENDKPAGQASVIKKKESDKLRALRRQALEAEAVKDALEVFDGEVVEVKVDRRQR